LAVEKGWHKEKLDVPLRLALIHSELSEALEEWRNEKPDIYVLDGKPEGVAVELVDALIRILDALHEMGVDIDAVVRMKHQFNAGRPIRHGGKRA